MKSDKTTAPVSGTAIGHAHLPRDNATLVEFRKWGNSLTGSPPLLLSVPEKLLEISLKATGLTCLWSRIGRPLVARPRKLHSLGWEPIDTGTISGGHSPGCRGLSSLATIGLIPNNARKIFGEGGDAPIETRLQIAGDNRRRILHGPPEHIGQRGRIVESKIARAITCLFTVDVDIGKEQGHAK